MRKFALIFMIRNENKHNKKDCYKHGRIDNYGMPTLLKYPIIKVTGCVCVFTVRAR